MSFIMGKNMSYFQTILDLVNDANQYKDPQAFKKKIERNRMNREQKIIQKLEEIAKQEK